MIYVVTAIGLTPGGSSTVHIYTQTIQEHNNENEYLDQNIHNKLTKEYIIYKIEQKHT